MKVWWEIQPVPTGTNASFTRRAWPAAFIGDHPVARMECETDYSVQKAKTGKHPPITMYFAKYDEHGHFKWLKLNREYTSFDEAKKSVHGFYAAHPDFLPDIQ